MRSQHFRSDLPGLEALLTLTRERSEPPSSFVLHVEYLLKDLCVPMGLVRRVHKAPF